MKKNALFLTFIIAASLSTTCFAPRGRGGRGFRGGGRGARGFVAGGFRRGGRGFVAGGGFRRGGRGGFVIAGGRGRSRGWRHHRGWRRPWRRRWSRPWRRGWRWGYPYRGVSWGPRVVVSSTPSYRCIDNNSEAYWEVTNNSDTAIRIKSHRGPQVNIYPGETKSVNHPTCIFTVKTPYGNKTFQTNDHYISIEFSDDGELIAETS